MQTSLHAFGSDTAERSFLCANRRRACFRRWAIALLGAASLLWMDFAAAMITISNSTKMITGSSNRAEEPILLMHPGSTVTGAPLPLVRFYVVVRSDNSSSSGRYWNYTRLSFTNIKTGNSVTVCTDSDNIALGQDQQWISSASGFNLFGGGFSADVRKTLESLPAGDYSLSIKAFNTSANCTNDTNAISNSYTIPGTLGLKAVQEITSATVNGGSSVMLQPGDKLDLAFVMKSNRSDSLAKLERVEWLIASAPPTPVADNHAPGMTCAAPTSTSNGFNGTFSSKLSSGAVTVPANIAYGTYNLYLRGLGNTTTCSTLATYSYPITPLFELKNAIVFEPLVQHIKVVPSQLPPQPPATVGKNDVAITWEVKFYQPVKDVSENVFRLVTAGIGGAGASIVSVTGSGSVYYVTTKVPAGSVAPDQLASLRLDFDDDDSVLSATGDRPIGGTGHGNGNFTGETYALKGTICGASNVIWCDDFERSVQGSAKADLVGNGWVATTDGNCGSHTPGSSYQPDAGGCAGIDSDIKPYHNYANPRANSSRSMFNRWLAHAVTSEAIDLSGLPADAAVELSYWLRRGSDSFAEEPDESTANFMAEYLDKNSKWQMLAQHRATGGHAVAGEILRPVFQLPAEALWSGFRLRFRQNHGTGTASHSSATVVNGYDYWFIDDVVLRRIDAPRYAGGFCDNFEAPASSLKQWSFGHEDIATGADTEDLRIGEAGVTGDVYPTNGSSKHSMFLRWSYVVASTMRIDTRGLGGNIRYVAQRGMKNPPGKINGADVLTACDSTTANPKDKFVSEYFGGDGKWHALQSVEGVSGSSSCGQDISYASAALSGLPNAQHENFRLRFRQLSYSGYQTGNQHYDYWLVDDVCVGRTDGTFPRADLELTKTRENTLYPGGIGIYVLSAKNNGPDRMRGTLQIVDTLPSAMSFYDFQGSGWFCEADGQTVTCSWSGDLEKGQRAPDLRLYALVSPSATGVLKNKGTLSSGAVEDPVPGNNTSEDEGAIETIYFAFTKGQCKNGQAIGDVTSSAACSRYRFDGLAGETRSGIYITHTNVSGVTAASISSSVATALSLEFTLRCVDPSQAPPQGALKAAFGAGSSLPSLNVCADSGGTPSWGAGASSVTIAAGEATASGVYDFLYGDVGRLELLVRVKGDNARKGGSGVFVQKPARLVLKEVQCADGTANPPVTSANGARFCRAGEAFKMTVEAQSVQGNSTPNFGNENVPKGIFLEKRLLLPQDGNSHDPALALQGLTGFMNGAVTATEQSWPEVGIISITPRLGDAAADGGMILSDQYLGAGDVPSEGVSIGRFYPSHFQTEVGGVGRMECPSVMTCPEGGFFYTGQPFEVTVKACPYGDEVCAGRLENYRGDFAAAVKLSVWGVRGSNAAADQNPPNAARNGGYLEPMPGGGLSAPRITSDKFVGSDGFGGLFIASFRYAHTLKTEPVEPSDIYIRAEEDGRDGISSRRPAAASSSPEGGIRLARGRLLLGNNFGSERGNLEIPLQIQFWHCVADRCDWMTSATDATRIEPDSALADADKRAALAVSLHQMEGRATVAEVDRLELSSGAGKIVLRPPGGEASFNVSVNLGDSAEDNACDHAAGGLEGAAARRPWLRAWNGTCAQAQSGEADPSARATFGAYSGERRRSVHSRELY